jgi:hypothetical protein
LTLTLSILDAVSKYWSSKYSREHESSTIAESKTALPPDQLFLTPPLLSQSSKATSQINHSSTSPILESLVYCPFWNKSLFPLELLRYNSPAANRPASDHRSTPTLPLFISDHSHADNKEPLTPLHPPYLQEYRSTEAVKGDWE